MIQQIEDLKLSPKEEKAFEVLCDPTNKNLTLEEKANKAGISRVALWMMLKRERFINALKTRNISYIRALSVDIVNKIADQAKKGEFNQQKLALEIANDLLPKNTPLIDNRQVNITISPEKEERLKLVVSKLEQLQAKLKDNEQSGEIIDLPKE